MSRKKGRNHQLLLLTAIATVATVAGFNLARPPVVQGQSNTPETTEQTDPRLVEAEELQEKYSELYEQGKYLEAIPLAEKALSLRQQVLGDDHLDVALSMAWLGFLYRVQGRYPEAEPLYLQALAIWKKQLGEDHPDVATSLNNLAALYKSQGRYPEAEPLYLQALAIRKKQLGEDHPDVATSLNNLAVLAWSQEEITSTLTYLQQGLAVEEYNLHYNLPAGSESQKQAYLRTRSGSSNAPISFHLETAPQNTQASVLAFTTIAQRKGRLLDFMSNSQQLLRRNLNSTNQQLLDDINTAKSKLANLYHYRPSEITPEYQQQLQQLSQEITTREGKLSRNSSLYRTATQPITLEGIQQQLTDDTALIEFVKYSPYNPKEDSGDEPRYAVYLLHKQGRPQGIDLGTVTEIESQLELLLLAFKDRGTPLEQVKEYARAVDQLLMEPVRQHLGDTRKLLIAPDHNLNTIPFEALIDSNNEYLVQNYQITYLTSSRDLVRMARNHESQSPPLVMGNPDFQEAVAFKGESEDALIVSNNNPQDRIRWSNLTQWAFSPIPDTETEVTAIGKLLGVQPLIQGEATESVVKTANSPQILHIATHGFFQTSTTSGDLSLKEHPLLLSGLVLAGFQNEEPEQQSEDGVLSALEVTGINLLGTKLVILSACDTGRGNVSTGDGIYGLRRALVIAGAQTQVISLWRVDDASTKELMVAYYQRLKRGEGRSEALRQTQLEILQGRMEAMREEKYQHPYYWAGFIASGNWRPMDFD